VLATLEQAGARTNRLARPEASEQIIHDVRRCICRPVSSFIDSEWRAMNIVWFLVIGLAAGWLAGQFMKGGGFGLIGDLIVGVIGALLGGLLFGLLGISAGGLLGALVTATVGAVVLIFLLRLIKRA
jgi:uncharacterized membrane protein YeaQ/YmgE (transglycosylase-associated protein family)